jgi:hypothetical protein
LSSWSFGGEALPISIYLQPYFFCYADPSEKFQFLNHYNFWPDELFRLKSSQLSILSGVLSFFIHKKFLRCLILILDFKIFHLGRHRKKNTAVLGKTKHRKDFLCINNNKTLLKIDIFLEFTLKSSPEQKLYWFENWNFSLGSA